MAKPEVDVARDTNAPSGILLAVQNALKLGSSLLFTWGIALAMRLLLPRYLGPIRFGTLNFADGFTTAFFTLLVPQAPTFVGSIHLGRLLQLLVLDDGPVSQWGPAITSWQLSLCTQGTLAVICVFGAVLLVRGRRARPLRRIAVKAS